MTTTHISRWQALVGALGLVVVLWVGDRLYDVISSGASGPAGGHQPPGGAPTTEPTDGDGDVPPPAGKGHDPSQFDHG